MTTSSSDKSRCTRISPSAVLDDRLDGKDLEWARDHLRRCEPCRERVENFREMLLRVGRLPSATVGTEAMDQAYAAAIPERLRQEGGGRSYDFRPPAPAAALSELPSPIRPEIASVPDLLTELEREIFRDEPVQDHPTPLPPRDQPFQFPIPATTEAIEAEPAAAEVPTDRETEAAMDQWQPAKEPAPEPEPEVVAPSLPEELPASWRQVAVDSHQDPEPPPLKPAAAIATLQDPSPAHDEAARAATPIAPSKSDTVMRIAVGLGAAACVLLAALLYEGGWFVKAWQSLAAPRSAATASIRPTPSARLSPSPSASATTSSPPAPILFTLGNGAGGDSVFRIRPGTAVAGYTRLVFDMRGSGLPTMVIQQPDTLHLTVRFKNASAAGLAVSGIRSYQVAGIEPAVQDGADAVLTIDLARPVRVTAFTLPATGSYAWRLVTDLHTT
jgi:hypothetical protein